LLSVLVPVKTAPGPRDVTSSNVLDRELLHPAQRSTTPVCVEQPADRDEAAAALRSTTAYRHRLKTFPSDPPMDTGEQTDDCSVMRRRSPSIGGAIQNNSVTVTV